MKKKGVALALGVSLPTLRDYERRGIAPYSYERFGQFFYEVERVRQFVEESTTPYRSPR